MNKNILHTIFFDENNHWDQFSKKIKLKIRPVVFREVEKFRYCGDISKGFRLFVCEGCHAVKKVPIRCKGKFCPTCSVGESERWSEIVSQDMFHTTHRHIVFTIDEGLRNIFLKYHREILLKGLMDEAAQVILDYFKKQKIRPGIILTLHTFGSKLEFNPHVHMIVTMGGLTKGGEWKDYDYIPYKMLRINWQNAVLKLIRRVLSPKEKKEVQPQLQTAYTKNAEGFYVNAPKRSRTNVKRVLQYISRYMKRGPIALKRILMYDGDIVMFRYHDKRTDTDETEIMLAKEFIAALVRHIPDKNFKMIRRYGLYSRKLKTVAKEVVKEIQSKIKRLLLNVSTAMKPKKWAERIVECFGENPLKCSCCGNLFVFRGIVVSKNGELIIQYANDSEARRYLREEIRYIESKEFKINQKQAEKEIYEAIRFDWEKQRQLYMPSMRNQGIDSEGSRG